MRITLGPVLLAIAILLAPVVWHLSARYLGGGERIESLEGQVSALRSQLNGELVRIDALSDKAAALDQRTARMQLDLAALREGGYAGPAPSPAPGPETSGPGIENYAMVVKVADRRSFNTGLTVATPSFLGELLGPPREQLTDDCEEMENEELKGMLELADVGPIKVRMLRPAILSLQQIFRNIEVYEPDLYARISSAGSLCVRRIRGSETAASAHAYGLAVDLNIDGQLDTLGDGQTQLGLVLLAEKFNQEGWIWGAGFGREDSMHFEVSREKLEQWRRLGEI